MVAGFEIKSSPAVFSNDLRRVYHWNRNRLPLLQPSCGSGRVHKLLAVDCIFPRGNVHCPDKYRSLDEKVDSPSRLYFCLLACHVVRVGGFNRRFDRSKVWLGYSLFSSKILVWKKCLIIVWKVTVAKNWKNINYVKLFLIYPDIMLLYHCYSFR